MIDRLETLVKPPVKPKYRREEVDFQTGNYGFNEEQILWEFMAAVSSLIFCHSPSSPRIFACIFLDYPAILVGVLKIINKVNLPYCHRYHQKTYKITYSLEYIVICQKTGKCNENFTIFIICGCFFRYYPIFFKQEVGSWVTW